MKKILFIFTLVIISGCFNIGNENGEYNINIIQDHIWKIAPSVNEGRKTTIRVALFDTMSSPDRFMQLYGTSFMETYKNITVEFVTIPKEFIKDNKKTAEFLLENDADLLVSHLMEYQKLANNQLLLDLSPLSAEYDIDQFALIVLNQLMDNNSNKLYGLAPGFSSVALYYNKDLFDEYHIRYPDGNMTWNEVFQLANQFVDLEDPTFGLFLRSYGTIRSLSNFISTSKNLKYLDNESREVTINSPEWREAYSLVLDGIKSRILPDSRKLESNLFVSGEAAMTVDYEQLLNNLKSSSFKWGVVVQPKDSVQNFSVGAIYSVLIHSKKQEVALDLLKYINSDEIMKKNKEVPMLTTLPSRVAQIQQNEIDLQAFYDPGILSIVNFENTTPPPLEFTMYFDKIFEEEMNDALLGKETLDEALTNIQIKAQRELNYSWQNQK